MRVLSLAGNGWPEHDRCLSGEAARQAVVVWAMLN